MENEGLFGEREKVYDAYPGEAVTSPVEEVTEPTEESKEKPKAESKEKPKEEPTEDLAEEVIETPVEEGELQEEVIEKTVPLQALHEEREKRKVAQADIRNLTEKVNSLIEDNRQLMEHYTQEPEEIEDYDKELLALKKQNKELVSRLDTFEKSDTQHKQERQVEAINVDLKKLDSKLTAEGYPGMLKFQNLVVESINELRETDFDRYETIMSSKANWFKGCEEIYKKEVFSGIKNIFSKTTKAEKDLEKEELKKKAKLAGKTGATGERAKGEEEGEWTYDDYMKERKKNSVIGGGL